jgi:hypothetical protein
MPAGKRMPLLDQDPHGRGLSRYLDDELINLLSRVAICRGNIMMTGSKQWEEVVDTVSSTHMGSVFSTNKGQGTQTLKVVITCAASLLSQKGATIIKKAGSQNMVTVKETQ